MKILITVSLVLISLCELAAQTKDIRIEAVQNYFEAYNKQDYKKMQKHLAPVGKIIISKKMLRKAFAPTYDKLGKANIDTITYSNKYHYRAQLSYEKDKLERGFTSFFFNAKGQITGFGDSEPSYIYPKTEKKARPVDAAEQIIEIINKKHLQDSLDKFNGNVLVIDQGKEILNKSFGYSDFDKQTPINEHTRFDLASCSKQFTAMAIMMLEEEGKLSYTDNIKKHIPQLPYDSINIEHLLTHTSGLPSYQGLVEKEWDKSRFITNYDIVNLLEEHKPDIYFKPGKTFRYSNTAYVMLAIIIEKASGISYEEFLTKNIFEPLEMNETRIYNTKRSKKESIENLAYGYVLDKETNKYIMSDSSKKHDYVVYMDPVIGDGAIYSTTHDLTKWLNTSNDLSLVSKSSWERARTKLTLNSGTRVGYGYGLFVSKEEGMEEVIHHTGSWPGYISIVMQLPNQNISIAILSNNNYIGVLNMADDILAILLELK